MRRRVAFNEAVDLLSIRNLAMPVSNETMRHCRLPCVSGLVLTSTLVLSVCPRFEASLRANAAQTTSHAATKNEAAALVSECIASQRLLDRMSFNVAANIQYTHDGHTDIQKSEAWIRRDQDRMDSAGKYLYEGTLERKSYSFRSIVDNARFVQFTKPLTDDSAEKTESQNLSAATSVDRRQYFFRVGRVPHYGGFLDGYFGGFDYQSIFDVLLNSTDLRMADGEEIDGSATKKITGATTFGTGTIWIAPSKGYTLQKVDFVRVPIADRAKSSDAPGKKTESSRLVSEHLVLNNISTEEIRGVHVPVSGTLRIESRYSKGNAATLVFDCRRDNIELNPVFSSDAFVMQLPDGTPVSDWDHPKSGLRHEWQNGRIVPTDVDFSHDATGQFTTSRRWILIATNAVVVLILAIVFFVKSRTAD
jgi:hypothetical protein